MCHVFLDTFGFIALCVGRSCMVEESGTLESQLEATKVSVRPVDNLARRVDLFSCVVVLGFSAAQTPGDPCHAQPAEENRGPWSSYGRGTDLGQQIHRTQHSRSGTTVGPTWPTGHENATQPGTTDPSQVPHFTQSIITDFHDYYFDFIINYRLICSLD